MGKIRHLDFADLWVQEKIRSSKIVLEKILGAKNPADAFTKHVPREMLQMSMAKAGMIFLSGRPKCAPDTLGLQ